jgi:hypothetical protein
MAYHHVDKRTHAKAMNMLTTGGYTKKEIAKSCKVSYQTILNWSKDVPPSKRKRSYSGKVKLYKCQAPGCKSVAEGMLGGKWLCKDHRTEETANRMQMMNTQLAEKMNVEVVPMPDVVLDLPGALPEEPIKGAHAFALEQAQEMQKLQAVVESNRAVKYDDGKPAMHLVDYDAILGLAKVLAYGAKKYEDPHNWRKGMNWSRVIASAMRHMADFAAGRNTDAESGLPTIDHAMACVMFLSWYQKHGAGTDDRWKANEDDDDV